MLMQCKFFFRGKAVEVRPRRFTGKVGKVLTIDGTDYEVAEISYIREDFQSVALHRCTPDFTELQIVERVINEIRSGLRSLSPSNEPYQAGCNLPQVRGKREGREETLMQIRSILDSMEEHYLSGG